jgi:hypothetical protein
LCKGGQPDGEEEIDPVFYLLFMSIVRMERDIRNTNTRVSPNDLLVAMGIMEVNGPSHLDPLIISM